MMLVLRRKWDFEGHHNFSSWSAKWIENDISSMHFDCKNENNWKYFIIHLILSQKCTRRWGFPSHYLFVGENITKYQIERIQIYTDCKISVYLWLFGNAFKIWEDIFLRRSRRILWIYFPSLWWSSFGFWSSSSLILSQDF